MTDHTPTTEKVRDAWAYMTQDVDFDGNALITFDEAAQRFDRWLAAHNRKIAAEALRTEAFSGLYGTFAQKRLLTRADRIEQGGQS